MQSNQTNTNNSDNKEVKEYLTTLAMRHYKSSFIRNKDDNHNKETYFKCWIDDMSNILTGYNINQTDFYINLLNY